MTYTPRPCRMCGEEKEHKSLLIHRWYCVKCGKNVRDEYHRKLSYCKQCTDRWNCSECKKLKKISQIKGARKAAKNRRKNNKSFAVPESANKYWQQRCHAVVCWAIKNDFLPSLKSGEYKCTDCESIAHEYGHRDYGRPLEVEPVCRSCNHKRGTAVWPEPKSFPKFYPPESEAA